MRGTARLGANMESTASVRYPGRIGLLGEHCDWAGGASLAAPHPAGVRASFIPDGTDGRLRLETELDGARASDAWPIEGSVERSAGPLRFVPAILRALRADGVAVPAGTLRVVSDLPTGRGFSSSAAFTLAATDVLATAGGRSYETEALARMAFHVEHDLLGVDCGLFDQLACSSRAPVLIEWEAGREAGFALRPVAPATDLHLVVGAFTAPRDTGAILSSLNADFFGGGRSTREAFTRFARAAVEGAAAIEAGDIDALGAGMDDAQEAYESLLAQNVPGLAAPGLVEACRRLRALGAAGAKFSGAGGDGSVVALFHTFEAAESAAASLAGVLPLRASYVRVSAAGLPG